MGSIVSQVMGAIEKVDAIGKSKKDFREKGLKGIHSHKQKEDCKSIGVNFAKWAREEHGVKKLHQITPEHYKSYIEKLENEGLSKGYIRNVETSIRLVNHGFDKISSERGFDSVTFTTKERLIAPAERGENVQDRSYSNTEISNAYSKMSSNVQNAVKLMRGLGLRGAEVANIRVEHFKGDKLVIERGEGITKGGRERVVPIPERMRSDIKNMVQGKEATERVIP
ncbi:hypothetical protein, partial [Catellatospora coxensis]|uniref:hypothetical protein n=1 Tax=Catellatospora coxensis TaxID=310354 RepID=UPI0031D251BA